MLESVNLDSLLALTVNGQVRNFKAPLTVARLLEALEIKSKDRGPIQGLAVAVNDEVIPQSAHQNVLLKTQDRVEIIHPVGGG